MNVERLNKLADFLDELAASEFDFNKVARGLNDDAKCGAVCCAVGWTPKLFPDLVRWVPDGGGNLNVQLIDGGPRGYSLVAARLFDISDDDASNLFTPRDQYRLGEEFEPVDEDALPSEVAALIRLYIKVKGGAAWSDTPRVEAFAGSDDPLPDYYKTLEFARELERELNSAHAQIEEMIGEMMALAAESFCLRDSLKTLLAAEQASKYDFTSKEIDGLERAMRLAKETLDESPPVIAVVPLADAEALATDLEALRYVCKQEGWVVKFGDASLAAFRAKHPKQEKEGA